MRGSLRELCGSTALVLGGLLLVVNLVGLCLPLRHRDLVNQVETEVNHRPLLTESAFYERIERGAETDLDYATNLTQAVHEGLLHIRPVTGDLKFHWKVPFYENYLLWGSRYALLVLRAMRSQDDSSGRDPRRALCYEFSSAAKGLERGIGMCAQHTVVVMGLLGDEGISARKVGVACADGPAHSIIEARLPGADSSRWILDADYGVAMPLSAQQMQDQPDLVRPYYAAAGYEADKIETVTRIYRDGTYRFIPSVRAAHGGARYAFEYISYYLIWVIPVVLMLPTIYKRCSSARRRSRSPA